jgi:uncharacterized Tic20 family protein
MSQIHSDKNSSFVWSCNQLKVYYAFIENRFKRSIMSEQTPSSQEETPLENLEPEITHNDKQMGMFCHLAAFAGMIIPFGSLIGPLIIWQMKKDESEYINYHGKESLNFQITMAIALLISIVLMFVLIGFLLVPALVIFELVMIIIAAIKANDGVKYEYPISFRFIK